MAQSSEQTSSFLPTQAAIALDSLRVIRVHGPGTDQFLNGQLSQKLDEVTSQWAPRAAACTPKGRTYALTRLVRDGDDVLFCLPEETADNTLAQLKKYVMLFRGTSLEDDSQWKILGILGLGPVERSFPEALQSLTAPSTAAVVDKGILVRTENTAEGQPRFELWHSRDASALAGDGTQEHVWHASEIAAGIARLVPEAYEQYVPQMLNWQHVNGVHFKKGCYTGQEIVARMHYLGQLKKSLYRLSISGSVIAPGPGTPVMTGDKAAGEIVNAVKIADDETLALAVLRHDRAGDDLILSATPEATLHRQPLPYSVPEQEQKESQE